MWYITYAFPLVFSMAKNNSVTLTEYPPKSNSHLGLEHTTWNAGRRYGWMLARELITEQRRNGEPINLNEIPPPNSRSAAVFSDPENWFSGYRWGWNSARNNVLDQLNS